MKNRNVENNNVTKTGLFFKKSVKFTNFKHD